MLSLLFANGPFPESSPIVTLVERESGQARSQVVPARVTGKDVRGILLREVSRPAVLYTDESGIYSRVGPKHVIRHQVVNHAKKEWARGEVGTNVVEGFFGQLKRSLNGTYHHVSADHLDRYLAEFDFRYSTHKRTDSERLDRLFGQTHGRRLTYRELTEAA